ncbi:MAG: MBL fold metallo-hydrolase [Acidobacteria bacterium]|nr:MBL fold metallo-hydrolase [Acidobacteriota bacterium]
MKVTVLGSGSSGNATLVENCESAVLIDAGFSCRDLETRIRFIGSKPEKVRAIIISHEHTDHTKGAEVFSKRYRVPVYMSEGTCEVGNVPLKNAFGVEPFVVGNEFSIDGFNIQPFRIPHDAVDPAAFVIERSGIRLGHGTDIGYINNLIRDKFKDLDMLIFESNYDPDMLRNGPYPWFLKQRITSRNGHLSNDEAAEFVGEMVGEDTRHLVLAHLSRTNNNPQLAERASLQALEAVGNSVTEIHVTSQFECSRTINLEE